MEANPKTQSSLAGQPPPGSAVPAVLRPPAAASAPSILPLHRLPQCSGDANAQLGSLATTTLPFAANHLPAAVGPYLAEALEARWKSYRKQLRHCQQEFSEEAVHELRVATRRLLAQFVLLSCVAPSAGLEKAHRILKRQTAALGDLRDTQVQLRFVDQEAARFPELAPLGIWLRFRERRLIKSAAKTINRFRTKKLGRWIVAMTMDLVASAGTARARKQLASAVVRATAKAFAEAVKRRQAIDLADLVTVHQTRVAFKRFRYIVESLSPGLTGLTKRQLRALAYYQRRMGIIQDLEVMKRCVAGFVCEHKRTESALRPFCRYLRQRRARALRSFLKSADCLFEFWPPANLAASGHSAWSRKAA